MAKGSRRVGRPSTTPKAGVKATLNVRASPALKRQLLAAAKLADRSLSAEMEVRLEGSFRDEAIGGTVFRDHATFQLLDEFARTLRAVEIAGGTSWQTDLKTLLTAC